MELQYHGANCVRISSKKASIVVDDNLESLGLKSVTKPSDIVIATGAEEVAQGGLVFNSPGEYEASDVSIHGVAARSHMDEEGKHSSTIFKLVISDIRIVVVGHIFPELSDEQLEAIGIVDILVVPVGGNGYTLDGVGALKIIKEIEPKIVIPTHYADKSTKYEVPQVDLVEALKVMSMEPKEKVEKLKIKSGELPEIMQLVLLERQ